MGFGTITVVNRERGGREIEYIGRGSVYGNPFVIGRDGNRQEVIAKYEERLKTMYRSGGGTRLVNAIGTLSRRVREGEDIKLSCFCAPQACHGDVIKARIEMLNSALKDVPIKTINRLNLL
jgi:hypothetical protein|tara:strand:+ start:335 stop:697 length:363 start_codon:yes stop_codon:yes gene_type:complete